jgi:DNA polymerase
MAVSNPPAQQDFLFGDLGDGQGAAAPAPRADSAAVGVATDEFGRVQSLDELAALAATCERCSLRRGCARMVFGEGNPAAQVLFVGEGPGETEDQLGRPFVGRAGQLLDKILVASGFAREEVYIANVVKCRPPGNRQPTAEESAACLPWLEAQIRIIAPRFVVALGASAAQTLLDPKLRITGARGKWYDRNGIRCMPTFHPAALLRDPSKKRPVWEDMKKLRAEFERQRTR